MIVYFSDNVYIHYIVRNKKETASIVVHCYLLTPISAYLKMSIKYKTIYALCYISADSYIQINYNRSFQVCTTVSLKDSRAAVEFQK